MIIIIATIKSTPRTAVKMIHNALSEKNPRLELGARLVGGSDEIKKEKEINFPHKSCFSVTLISFSNSFLCALQQKRAHSRLLYLLNNAIESWWSASINVCFKTTTRRKLGEECYTYPQLQPKQTTHSFLDHSLQHTETQRCASSPRESDVICSSLFSPESCSDMRTKIKLV